MWDMHKGDQWHCLQVHLERDDGAAVASPVPGGRPAGQRQWPCTPHSARRRTAARVLQDVEDTSNDSSVHCCATA